MSAPVIHRCYMLHMSAPVMHHCYVIHMTAPVTHQCHMIHVGTCNTPRDSHVGTCNTPLLHVSHVGICNTPHCYVIHMSVPVTHHCYVIHMSAPVTHHCNVMITYNTQVIFLKRMQLAFSFCFLTILQLDIVILYISFHQPHQSCHNSFPNSLVKSSFTSSPLTVSITPSLFHSTLKTYLLTNDSHHKTSGTTRLPSLTIRLARLISVIHDMSQ